ncbi:MAG: carboxylating nicotinate-nucleotide diphosphorylase [Verrucomicrobia bacterium]|nr:carboxylating nicotinate-nucleotide diphosphorylase [Verrucomicrobiota bacterium]
MDERAWDSARKLIREALREDLGPGDLTTRAVTPPRTRARAVMRAREALVPAGLEIAEAVFRALSKAVRAERIVEDGRRVEAGAALLRLEGPARPILSGERVALNFVQRLSGVATLTAQYVEKIAGTRARILDTRKTTPGWRALEKYATRCGGAENHRMGLYDRILIKDNHLAALRDAAPNPIAAATALARRQCPGVLVEVEADTLDQVRQAVEAGADWVLLDNMDPKQLREAVRLASGKARTEASGGVTLQTVRQIAETGVDYISVGAVTHSARAVDIGLDFEG